MSGDTVRTKRSLAQRLASGPVICAEGYLFELERRGYLQAGSFVPEVVLEHPDALAQLHREFVRAGSDVIEAFTYYGHREKLRLIGKEHLLEPLNRQALELAHTVAAEFDHDPPLVAGNLSNTNIYRPDDATVTAEVRRMFDEQAGWAADGGADYIVAETLYYAGEARLALEAIRRTGLPAVVTLALPQQGSLLDGDRVEEACKLLADEGADVVGLNCFRGPATMLPALRLVQEAVRFRSRACRFPTARPRISRRSSACPTPTATCCRRAARSRPRSSRFCATASRSPRSPTRPSRSVSPISGCVAVRRRNTFVPWPKPSGVPHRPAGTHRTCPSTSPSAPTRG